MSIENGIFKQLHPVGGFCLGVSSMSINRDNLGYTNVP